MSFVTTPSEKPASVPSMTNAWLLVGLTGPPREVAGVGGNRPMER